MPFSAADSIIGLVKFEKVIEGCPVPVIIAGGKKVEKEKYYLILMLLIIEISN